MTHKTIRTCILDILNNNVGQKLSAKEITDKIIKSDTYNFINSQNPTAVVGSELSKMIKGAHPLLNRYEQDKPYLYFIQKDKS